MVLQVLQLALKEGGGWRTHVYLWQIHFDIWQNQYNIVKLNKIKFKKIKKSSSDDDPENIIPSIIYRNTK